ncbi:MAG: ATP-dependent DNA helicase RecG [Thermoleophilia bacterium]
MRSGGKTRPVFPFGSKKRLPEGERPGPTSKARLDPRLLDQAVTSLKGVGGRTAAGLARMGIETVGDLLEHIPFRYEEPASLVAVRDLSEEKEATVKVRVHSSSLRRTRRPGLKILEAIVGDDTGSVKAVWYNQEYLADAFALRPELLIRGRLKRSRGELSLSVRSHEIISESKTHRRSAERPDGVHTLGVVPVYPATGELSVRRIRTLVARALPLARNYVDPLPASLLTAMRYPRRPDALAAVHFPARITEGRLARDRLAFEELLLLQVALLRRRARERGQKRAVSLGEPGDLVGRYLAGLPFAPTRAQSRVIREIDADLAGSAPMRRLLQGDVGSGKTLVATYALLRGLEAGGQAAMMAPTEVLADQHAMRLGEQLADLGILPVLLKGSQSAQERREALRVLESEDPVLVIGTHALIQESVRFRDLRVVVIDEQHRFGVEQRQALLSADELGHWPHVLHMTATPIPRTLSLTLYGDLDLSVLDELPPGRTPVRTRLVREDRVGRMWAFVRRELDEGRQAYVVCPLIEENDALCVASATKKFSELAEGELAGYRIGLLHGQMPAAEKRQVMGAFAAGELQVLVSTTVIEVGIDVSNASVMVIEGARRFGLSQLHQLRGRVGRGAAESFCLLTVDATDDEETRERLALFARTSDGFALAEADLAGRGEGQLFGRRQSGFGDLRVARLTTDARLLYKAREAARRMLETDPGLEDPRHVLLREEAARRFEQKTEWLDRA